MEIYIGWNLPPTVKLFLFTSYDFMQRSLNKLTQTSKNRLSISLLFGSWRLRLARVWLTVTCLKEGERVAASLINQIMSILTHYKHSQLQAPTGPSHRNTALRLTSHLWYQSFRGSARGGEGAVKESLSYCYYDLIMQLLPVSPDFPPFTSRRWKTHRRGETDREIWIFHLREWKVTDLKTIC